MLNTIIYMTVLAIYLPGLSWIINRNGIIKSPFTSIFMLSSFVFLALGSFYVLYPINITGKSLTSLPYLIIIYVQPLIFYISICLPPFNKISTTDCSRKKMISLSRHFVNICFIWCASFLIIFIYCYTVGMPMGFDFQNWFVGSAQLVSMRQEQTYIRRFWLIREGFYNLPTLAAVYSFIVWCFYKNSITSLFMLMSILFAVLLSFAFLFKTPLFILLSCIMLGYIIKNGKFYMRYIFYICLIAIIVFSFFYYMYVPGHDLEYYSDYLLFSFLNRIMGSYTVSLANIIENSLMTGNYYFGTTLINPLGIFTFEPVNLSMVSHELLIDALGNTPVPFLGEGFVNFSWMGIILFFLIVLFCLNILSFIAKQIKDRISYIVFVVYIIFSTYEIAFVSINHIISPVFILKVVLIFLLLTPFYGQLSPHPK